MCTRHKGSDKYRYDDYQKIVFLISDTYFNYNREASEVTAEDIELLKLFPDKTTAYSDYIVDDDYTPMTILSRVERYEDEVAEL